MTVIGYSYNSNGSSVSAIKDGVIKYAEIEHNKPSSSFPSRTFNNCLAIKDSKTTFVTTDRSVNKSYKNTVVSYKEALAMSAIVTTTWEECAIVLVDTYYVALGYYTNKKFYWIKEFPYPNNLCLFYSAVTAFLGYSPLNDEPAVSYIEAEPTYYNWLKNYIITFDNTGYDISINLERGIGVATENKELAASTQKIFVEIIASLFKFLQRNTATNKVAYAGWATFNTEANSAISNIFDHTAFSPAVGGAGVSLGAAALIERPLFENAYLGSQQSELVHTDVLASRLLEAKTNYVTCGRKAFSYSSLGTSFTASAIFSDNIAAFKNDFYFITQEKHAERFFNINSSSFKQFRVSSELLKIKNKDILTVTSSSNPYVNRVLDLLKLEGHYALIAKDVNV